MPTALTNDQLQHDLALRDLTDPEAGPHAIQLLVDLAVGALVEAWNCKARVERGPRIVPLEDNYDRLGCAPSDVTRHARYTRYVDDRHMLRSHSTAMVPPALDRLASDASDDELLVCPGITYRRDAIDRLHTGTPHQLDLWRITRRRMGHDDLEQMIRLLVNTLVPGREWRWEQRVHPYTAGGRQVDVLNGDEWVEVWECGIAHPEVLAGAGLAGWSGLALGMGLDRLLMLRKGVPDIRLLRSADPRVAGQMNDLMHYRPVSNLPALTRDLSVATGVDDDAEQLGDRIRNALGARVDVLEAVTVLSETPYAALPPIARERLGISANQKNVLVRVHLRPTDRTLTDAEANALRDDVYDAIHRGSPGRPASLSRDGSGWESLPACRPSSSP